MGSRDLRKKDNKVTYKNYLKSLKNFMNLREKIILKNIKYLIIE